MGKVLITGGAGFIGSHVAERLIAAGDAVRVLDNFDPYYDPRIKRDTAESLAAQGVEVVEGDVRDPLEVRRALADVDRVVHLAARPGVRASLEDPRTTVDINITGTLNVLEALRAQSVGRLVFASSSSVYGGDAVAPFEESQPASRPLSPYAASKRAGEHLCASYAEAFGLGVVALRFFTVYGPRGRPDMAIGKFGRLALEGQPLPLYGDGSVVRDFTYVDDIVTGILAALERARPGSGLEVINLGGGVTASMRELLTHLEHAIGAPLTIETHPAAAGDMPLTHADLTRARELLGFRSTVGLSEGVQRTVAWLRGALLPDRT